MLSIIVIVTNLFFCNFILRFCNFGNALTLKEIDENDILIIENDIRTKMVQWLENHSLLENSDSLHLSDIVGSFYSSNPKDFQFLPGDKKMIKQLAKYVGKTVDNNGFKYFKRKTKGRVRNGAIQTPLGQFYGKCTNQNNWQSKDLHGDHEAKDADLKELLFNRVRKSLLTYGDAATQFTNDMVVVQKNANKITGRVDCVFCANKNSAMKKTFSVYFDSTYWVVSNFEKHLKKSHSIEASKSSSEHNNIQSLGEMNRSINSTIVKIKIEPVENDEKESSPQIIEIDGDSIDDVDGVFTEENIDVEVISQTESDHDSLENDENITHEEITQDNFIYSQICDQESKIRSLVLTNGESEYDMPVQFSDDISSAGSIKVVAIKPDGNCLFGSLVHQLFYTKLGSENHYSLTNKLREEVVTHINSNLEFFQVSINGRIYDENKSKAKLTKEQLKKKNEDFLSERLPKSGTWGGAETILAVQQLYEVNIVILNESGTSYVIGDFNFNYEKCALIAYGYYGPKKRLKKEAKRNHYNSVSKVDQKEAFMCMKTLMHPINKKNESMIRLEESKAN